VFPFPPYRPHPGDEVYVTGDFDDWSKSHRLEKVGESLQVTVTFPDDVGKLLYKVSVVLFFCFYPFVEQPARASTVAQWATILCNMQNAGGANTCSFVFFSYVSREQEKDRWER
jgi:hypothetical protein